MAENTKKKKHIFARKGIRDIPSIAFFCLMALIRVLRLTWRVRIEDSDGMIMNSLTSPAIFASWHNRLILTPVLIPRKVMRNAAGLASDSRDGEYAARFMQAYGMHMVRGSTSRGGHRAIIGLRRKLREGVTVALTPDGPRGPRYEVQQGIVALAEKTGCPIVPLSMNSSRHWELKGWDRTQIPKPFAKVTLIAGRPLHIPPDLTPEQRQAECKRVREEMMRITVD